jgi:hypothetical protein
MQEISSDLFLIQRYSLTTKYPVNAISTSFFFKGASDAVQVFKPHTTFSRNNSLRNYDSRDNPNG